MSRKFNETKVPAVATDRVQLVKDFLTEHYEIKINVFDPGKRFILSKNKSMYKNEIEIDDISLHMESEGIRGCDTILKKIINSRNQVNTFNPIMDYLKSLEGAWKGESHIDRFCTFITARDFGDKTENHYQERFKYIFKKWLAATVSCALGESANDAMIGFVHADEGIGKTFALDFLVPKELKAYAVKSDKDERIFNITTAFTRNFIINFDEFVAITKNTAEATKKILSCTEVNINTTFTQTIPRIGSGVFTSNKTKEMGGFLTPSMGYRRFATVELEKIIHGYSKTVDVRQLWAEAYFLYKNPKFNHIWDMADFEEFKDYNAKYLIETPALQLIKEYYRMPEEGEECLWKQPIEILQDLRKAKKITGGMTNVSDVSLGMALRGMGFERKSKKINKLSTRYGYNVIQLFE